MFMEKGEPRETQIHLINPLLRLPLLMLLIVCYTIAVYMSYHVIKASGSIVYYWEWPQSSIWRYLSLQRQKDYE